LERGCERITEGKAHRDRTRSAAATHTGTMARGRGRGRPTGKTYTDPLENRDAFVTKQVRMPRRGAGGGATCAVSQCPRSR